MNRLAPDMITPAPAPLVLGAPGAQLAGPAIVEERESTSIVGARGRARVDERLNVIVEFADEK